MWPDRIRVWLRRVDHAAIFVLIAGTYTPLALTLPAPLGRHMLVLAWAGAALGIVRAVFWPRAPRWIAAGLALLVGWLSIGTCRRCTRRPLRRSRSCSRRVVDSYSLGALAYALRRPDPWPRVFGYHEIFHALVVLAASCHFAAIAAALPVLAA